MCRVGGVHGEGPAATLTSALAAFLVAVVACGAHRYINLDDVVVTRLPDGRAKVSATVSCEAVGHPCSEVVDEYCVVVQWTGASGALPAADRECVKNTLVRTGSTQHIDVVSRAPLPHVAALRAVVALATMTGGDAHGLGARGSPTTVDLPDAP